MSYGREPHYIVDCACAGSDETGEPHPTEPHVCFLAGCLAAVEWTALAQFIRKLRERGELDQVLDGTHPRLSAAAAAVPPSRG